MPLDAHVKGLLDMLAAANQPPISTLTAPEAREATMALGNIVAAKDVPIGAVKDGELPGPAGSIAYRLYTPVGAGNAPLPGIVYFHGGAWVFGNLESHEPMLRMLANESGCRIVSIDYRLAPEHRFPAAVEDSFAATRWIAAHAADFGIDPGRIAVAGDSAGGNLAAIVAQLARSAGPMLKLQVLFCPVIDVGADTPSRRDFAQGYFLEQALMEWAGAFYIPPGINLKDPRLSPLWAADLSGLPPAQVHTAAFDILRDEGAAYAHALERAGVAVSYTCHDGMIHHFYAMAGAIPYGKTALQSIGADIKAAMKPT